MFFNILLLIGVILLFFILIMVIDGNRFVVRKYVIDTPKIGKDFRFVLLSDLHNKQYGRNNSKLIQKIKELNPDAVLVAGDMLTAKPLCGYQVPVALFNGLEGKYPVYYGIGNHEYRMKIYSETYGNAYEEYKKELQKTGVTVLENNSIDMPEFNICIQGVMIKRSYYKRFVKCKMDASYLNREIGKPDSNKMQIFLAHNPDYFKEYAEAGADIVLSGHVHGGVMRLPVLGGVISPKCTLFPKYDGGLFQHKDSTMILSRGLGMHTIPVRIFNPGELVFVHLKSCK